MDLEKSQIFYRFLFQKLILQTSHLFLGAGRLGLVSGFRPKFYAKTRSRQRHPNKKEELFLFFGNLYPHNCMLYGKHPQKLTPENGPSHKVNNLPTINFQVLCLFQGGYHSLFFVGGSVVPRRPILETRRFLASKSADQVSIDGILPPLNFDLFDVSQA